MSDSWLESILPTHERLTRAVVTILQGVLKVNNIDYLSVTGRTKDLQSATEKIRRKGYANPQDQMTDLSGIRVVLFSETDVRQTSELITHTFEVDSANSLNQDDRLHANETGYRSVHFVCDIGSHRGALPEFVGLSGLRFEIQVRTVLQHAWAELSHDRNYKFSGKLPKELERRMYLYAGLLEIADKGFDDLSREIDEYSASLEARTAKESESIELNSISLRLFVLGWAQNNSIAVSDSPGPNNYLDLLDELQAFRIYTVHDLQAIIPKDFTSIAKKQNYSSSIHGLLRDWMLIHDWRRYDRDVRRDWVLIAEEATMFESYFSESEYSAILARFGKLKRSTERKRS